MVVTDGDLQALVSNGSAFEAMLHGLIRAEARACGISPDQIDWDYRTNVGDGGKDVLIGTGNTNEERKFIPPIPSIWSAKSGTDGLKAPTLRKEISTHPDVINHLKNGGAYVWCVVAAADSKARNRLRAEAGKLAKKHGFEPNQIKFLFRDHLTAWLNEHIGVAANHLKLPHGWRTLDEWKALDKNFSVPWIGFGDRAQLQARIKEHLLASSGPNVIHLAGWSGIGKTRTTLQSCLDEEGLEGTLYFPRLEDFVTGAEDHLVRNAGICTSVVIDEVEIDEWAQLRSRLSPYQNRMRVVTIGAGAQDADRSREGVIYVPPPENTGGVVAVVRSADPSLSDEQAADLVKWSDHDLRMALLLVEANRQDPGLTDQPISSVEDVIKRVLRLFKFELGDVDAFRRLFELLCMFIDIGNRGEAREELEYVAAFFGRPITDFDRAIAQSIKCGLGRQQGRFFEPTPRGLARRVFESIGWPQVSPTLINFISGMPNLSLQKRFIQRAQECNTHVRAEIASALAPWFAEKFPSFDIRLIFGRKLARLFMVYAELNPRVGLNWLRTAVEKATAEDLFDFKGEPDGSGGWAGRRQAVWLCEHLAQFPKFFWECEAILFRLGLHETEERTANNSRATWHQLFRPLFSWTAVPFDLRLKHLLKRLKDATVGEQSMIMGAVMNVVKSPVGSPIPPHIVGGQLVPKEWRPKTDVELRQIQTQAAIAIIDVIKGLPPDRMDVPRNAVIGHIGTFLDLGCLEQLRTLFRQFDLSEETLRELRISVDHHINWLKLHSEDNDWLNTHPPEEEKAWACKALEEILPWRHSLDPESLEARIREVTGRKFWQHKEDRLANWEEKVELIYRDLAVETAENLSVLDGLWSWFDSVDAHSAYEFGYALGRLEEFSLPLLKCLILQLAQGRATNLVAGYFKGISRLLGSLPEPLSQILDAAGERYPEAVSIITLHSDHSDAGFERLIRFAPRSGQKASAFLGGLDQPIWGNRLSTDQKAKVIQVLLTLGQGGDTQAYRIALDLVTFWDYPNQSVLPESIAQPIATILEECLDGNHHFDSWDWPRAVKMLPTTYNVKKCDLLTKALASQIYFDVRIEAKNLLTELAAEYPDEVMRAVGAQALDPKSRTLFLANNLRGLFETIGLDVVQRWVEEVGVEGARVVAGNLLGPSPTSNGLMYVPPLTEWILSKFEDDDVVFGRFLAGSHSGQVYCGRLSQYFEGTGERIKPYLEHPLRRIREWAQAEIDHAKLMCTWDEHHHAEFGRD